MQLTLIRGPSTSHSTPGTLLVDGKFECYTLEDVVRDKKIPGETAISVGTYRVIIDMSNRFKRLLPLLIDVPGFAGIRIHPGNTDADTEGCILVGQSRSKDFVGSSRLAFDALFAKMRAAKSITITIKDAA